MRAKPEPVPAGYTIGLLKGRCWKLARMSGQRPGALRAGPQAPHGSTGLRKEGFEAEAWRRGDAFKVWTIDVKSHLGMLVKHAS